MWIISTKGFYSIVQKPWDVENKTLTVRSRVWSDINNLRKMVPSTVLREQIKSSETADYRHRFMAPKNDVARAVAKLVQRIDYDNFKNTVDDPMRANVYGDVWYQLQELGIIDELEAEGK